jgi:hypothetical protein
MKKILTTLTLILLLVSLTQADPSPNVSVFAKGLIFPRGLKFGNDGNLYVAEAGTGGNMQTVGQCQQVPAPLGPANGGFTARISKINRAGVRTTVVDQLPSNTDSLVGDAIGIADLVFDGDNLYALSSGAGCSQGLAGTNNALLRINSNGTTTEIANLSAFVIANPVGTPDDDFTPDGTFYNVVTAHGDFYILESNSGMLLKVTPAGVVSRILDISTISNYHVPTALAYDGDFYIGNLNDFPTVDGTSAILKVTPDGQVSTFATGLTAVLALAFDSLHRLYVLETSIGNDFPTEGAGQILRFDNSGHREVIATGLSFPTAMTFGTDGNLYVSHRGYTPPNMGEIVKINLQTTGSQLANISARGLIQGGDNVLIAGFILQGSNRVIVRAIGPSLPVAGKLADPVLELHNGQGALIASNDNWRSAQQNEISVTGIPPANNLEAAIVKTLDPGSYTAVVRGKNGGTGIALVEMYSLLH